MFGIKKLSKKLDDVEALLHNATCESVLFRFSCDDLTSNIIELNNGIPKLHQRLEKIEDNFKKLELMMNEFKGAISMVRASLPKRSEENKK